MSGSDAAPNNGLEDIILRQEHEIRMLREELEKSQRQVKDLQSKVRQNVVNYGRKIKRQIGKMKKEKVMMESQLEGTKEKMAAANEGIKKLGKAISTLNKAFNDTLDVWGQKGEQDRH
ncbi:uncharacterized protein GGS22DRAFT_187872 [Annulohypoxylon maeteangense]|uniref:uncharacterized protein n=1 Tax=Annulohypoxylon maeteangense TaxID=1927788 RepID=UPI0020074E0B|nr:uncharacterized protein GGS22DRAFT_187872 [Annulohypoxylon maeteangense]KAI0885587.1 hypothetical protein GGS22DRAFT_187872 [Annulohypoxylon maeteangense]